MILKQQYFSCTCNVPCLYNNQTKDIDHYIILKKPLLHHRIVCLSLTFPRMLYPRLFLERRVVRKWKKELVGVVSSFFEYGI